MNGERGHEGRRWSRAAPVPATACRTRTITLMPENPPPVPAAAAAQKRPGWRARFRRLWAAQPGAVRWFFILSIVTFAVVVVGVAIFPSDTAAILMAVACVVVLSLALNAAAVTGALGALGRVYRGVLQLIAVVLVIGLAIWAVKAMSVQVAILLGAAVIAGTIWLTRR